MKTSPDHRAADVDSLSALGLFNLPRAASQTLMSMAAHCGSHGMLPTTFFQAGSFC